MTTDWEQPTLLVMLEGLAGLQVEALPGCVGPLGRHVLEVRVEGLELALESVALQLESEESIELRSS